MARQQAEARAQALVKAQRDWVQARAHALFKAQRDWVQAQAQAQGQIPSSETQPDMTQYLQPQYAGTAAQSMARQQAEARAEALVKAQRDWVQALAQAQWDWVQAQRDWVQAQAQQAFVMSWPWFT
jgi:hypothetical protein